MVEAPVAEETILDDPNFKALIAGKVDVEQFSELLEEHVNGYSQKKRLHDGLKDFAKKVEDAEQRLYVAKQVGKAKAQTNQADIDLTTQYNLVQLREKISVLNADLEAMIEQGRITHFEKPLVLENLRTRLAKAKEAGKAKLEEKLDRMLSCAAKADGSFSLPVASIAEFHRMETEIQSIEKMDKINAKEKKLDKDKKLEKAQKSEFLARKLALQAEFEALESRSHLWFETTVEFQPRVREAVAGFAAAEKERKKREEEEDFQRQIREQDLAQEAKRLEVARKEAEMAKELEDKLKAKRSDAAAKPVKEAPPKPQKETKQLLPPKPKEKKTDDLLAKLAHGNDDLWETLALQESQQKLADEAAAKAAQEEAERLQAEEEAALAAEEAAWAAEEAEKAARKAEEIARLKKQVDDSHKRREELRKHDTEKEQQERIKSEAAAKVAANPSISLKHAAARQTQLDSAVVNPAPRPKGKQNTEVASKWGAPVGPMQVGDDGDDILERLAAQEAKENAERAAAKKAAEEEATRIQAAEEALREAEEAAHAEKEVARLQQKLDPSKKQSNASSVASAGKPAGLPSCSLKQDAAKPAEHVPTKAVAKPKRSPPVQRESKWGKPANPACEYTGDELLEKLAAQEAMEKEEKAKQAVEAAISSSAAAEEEDADIAGAEKENEPISQRIGENMVESTGPSLASSLIGPSLAEAAKAPKKTSVAPQPKKKEKKTWAKLDVSAIGFDANNPNL